MRRFGMSRVLAALVVVAAPLFAPADCLAQEEPPTLNDVWPDRPRHPAFTDPIVPDSPNAAARYLWLFPRVDERLRTLAGHLRTQELVFAFDAQQGAPGTAEDLRATLIEQQEWIRALIEAARMERFDLRYSPDEIASNPPDDAREVFLSGCISAIRILRADAIRLWIDGKHEEAGDRLAGALGVALHCGRLPGPMVNQMGSATLLALVYRTALPMLAEGQPLFPPAARGKILGLLNRIDQQDPANRRAGWMAYQRQARSFAWQQLADGKVGAPLIFVLRMIKRMDVGAAVFRDDGADVDAAVKKIEEEVAKLDALTNEELAAQLKRIDDLAARIKAVWEDADAGEKIKAMEEEWKSDASGLSTYVLGFPREAQQEWQDSVRHVAELRSRFEAVK